MTSSPHTIRQRQRGPLIRGLIASAAASGAFVVAIFPLTTASAAPERALTLSWDKEILTVHGNHLPGGLLEIWYIEAFCRPGSTLATGPGPSFPTRPSLSRSNAGRPVDHAAVSPGGRRRGRPRDPWRAAMKSISGSSRRNPTTANSQAHWAQPCIRVNRYAGTKLEPNSEAYLPHCFIYVDGKPVRLPSIPGRRKPLYTPGQVWCPTASAATMSTRVPCRRSSPRTA